LHKSLISQVKSLIIRLRDEGLFLLLGILWAILISGAVVFYLLESKAGNNEINNLFDAFYWAWVTMTTVGYGDITPKTVGARIAAAVLMFLSMGLISLVTATISSIFVARKIREGRGLEKVHERDHYIICGWNNDAERLLKALTDQAGEELLHIVLVNDLPEEDLLALVERYKPHRLAFVRGDYTQDTVLEKANLTSAKAVLLLPNLQRYPASEVDEKTILATYSIKAAAPKLKVYAYLLSVDKVRAARRAKADGILVSDDYGPYLGAAQMLAPAIPVFLGELVKGVHSRLKAKPLPSEWRGKTYGEAVKAFYDKYRHTLLGVYREEKQIGLGAFLSADSSDYLDAFIQQKLHQAGRSLEEHDKVKVHLNPAPDTILNDGDYLVYLE